MKRARVLALAFAFVLGCASTGDHQQVKPLPADGQPVPYAELLTRARQQAMAATEAFHVNKWVELEDAARGIEETASRLGNASGVPEKLKITLPNLARNLGEEADSLRTAAKAKDVQKAHEIQQRIHLKVRELRLD